MLRLLYWALPSIAPGHEFAEASDFVVGNAGEHVRELGLWIDAHFEFAGRDTDFMLVLLQLQLMRAGIK